MAKYRDKSKGRRSRLVPYIHNEPARRRHARRHDQALEDSNKLREWCDSNGWEMIISNEGHHFRMMKGSHTVEWWPSTAKLVVNKKWKRGIHCHDYQIVIEQLARLK